MNDDDLLVWVLEYIYEKGGCDDIGVMMKHEHGIILERDRIHKLRRMAVSTGYVKEDSYAYGNHPHLSMSTEGTAYMMELNKVKREQPEVIVQKCDKWKIVERASYIAAIIGVLIALLAWLC